MAATAEVAALLGAAPVFVDIDPATFLIDIEDLERKIRDTRAGGRLRPRAVSAVDLFGLAADYDALRRVAEDHGLVLVADAAQSFGASRDGRRVGSLAPITATSSSSVTTKSHRSTLTSLAINRLPRMRPELWRPAPAPVA